MALEYHQMNLDDLFVRSNFSHNTSAERPIITDLDSKSIALCAVTSEQLRRDGLMDYQLTRFGPDDSDQKEETRRK